MKILEYEQVDPLDALHLSLLCLDFPLTPELAATIRQQDPRPFSFFCIYAQVAGIAVGQVGVFRLPMVSTEGADEVGGVWAVSTHPAYARQGIALELLEEAHARMRAAGLRFSTLGTDGHRVAHRLYEKLGYEDVFSSPSVVARLKALPVETGLRAERAGSDRLPLADDLFEKLSNNHLGFARRHRPFFPFLERRQYLTGQDLWLLYQEDEPVGYAIAFLAKSVLRIANLLLFEHIDPVAAVAAIARQVEAPYVQVTVDRLEDTGSYLQAGFNLAQKSWGTFMVNPLAAGVTVEDFRQLYGVNTNRFLISYMDTT